MGVSGNYSIHHGSVLYSVMDEKKSKIIISKN